MCFSIGDRTKFSLAENPLRKACCFMCSIRFEDRYQTTNFCYSLIGFAVFLIFNDKQTH